MAKDWIQTHVLWCQNQHSLPTVPRLMPNNQCLFRPHEMLKNRSHYLFEFFHYLSIDMSWSNKSLLRTNVQMVIKRSKSIFIFLFVIIFIVYPPLAGR